MTQHLKRMNGIAVVALMLSCAVSVVAQNQKGAGSAKPSIAETADLILSNGQVYTPGGWVQALAVRKGVIIALGNDESVQQYRTPQTRVIDLHGDTVMPGLHDMRVLIQSVCQKRKTATEATGGFE